VAKAKQITWHPSGLSGKGMEQRWYTVLYASNRDTDTKSLLTALWGLRGITGKYTFFWFIISGVLMRAFAPDGEQLDYR